MDKKFNIIRESVNNKVGLYIFIFNNEDEASDAERMLTPSVNNHLESPIHWKRHCPLSLVFDSHSDLEEAAKLIGCENISYSESENENRNYDSDFTEEDNVVGGDQFDDLWSEVVTARDKKRHQKTFAKIPGGTKSPIGSVPIDKYNFFDEDINMLEHYINRLKESDFEDELFNDDKQAPLNTRKTPIKKIETSDKKNEKGDVPLFPPSV